MDHTLLFGVTGPGEHCWKFVLYENVVLFHTKHLQNACGEYRETVIPLTRDEFAKMLGDIRSTKSAGLTTANGDRFTLYMGKHYADETKIYVLTASGDEFSDHEFNPIPDEVFLHFGVMPPA